MRNDLNFTGKTVMIVGASSGIGRQTAVSLSALGAQMVLIARREGKLRETVESLPGHAHHYFVFDVNRLDEIETLFKSVQEEVGPLDGLVYCAGVNSTLPLTQLKPSKLQETFSVNFYAFVEMVRQAAKRGMFRENMRIVAVSSNAANRGDKAHTAYSASKAAMNAAVRCMAKELADKKIFVNAVAPAITNTELYHEYASSGGGINSSEQALLARQYLGLVEPVDVAKAIAFLLSPASRALTGITLPVDGGMSTS